MSGRGGRMCCSRSGRLLSRLQMFVLLAIDLGVVETPVVTYHVGSNFPRKRSSPLMDCSRRILIRGLRNVVKGVRICISYISTTHICYSSWHMSYLLKRKSHSYAQWISRLPLYWMEHGIICRSCPFIVEWFWGCDICDFVNYEVRFKYALNMPNDNR